MSIGSAGNALVVGGGGGGGGSFNPSAGTATLNDTDSILVKDGNAFQTRTKRFMEASLEPIHIKPLVTETGYLYSTTSVTAGTVRLFDSGGNTIVGLVPKANFEQEIDEIMQVGFIVRIQNAANTVYREGVITGQSTQGGFRLGTLSSHGLLSAGTFSNDDQITFIAKGRHPLWSDFATAADIAAGIDGRKFITPASMATTTDANELTSSSTLMSPALVGQAERHGLSTNIVPGLRTTTAADGALGLGTFKITNLPNNRATVRIRAHSATESALIMTNQTGGSQQQWSQGSDFVTGRIAQVVPIPRQGSDVPELNCIMVQRASVGTLAANTDTHLSILGRLIPLRGSDRKFQVGGDTIGSTIFNTTTWLPVPHRNAANNTNAVADAHMVVNISNPAASVQCYFNCNTGWHTGSANWEGNLRLRYSTDGGTTYNTIQTFNNVLFSSTAANSGFSMGYLHRPNLEGEVRYLWEIIRKSSGIWFPENQSAFAVEI